MHWIHMYLSFLSLITVALFSLGTCHKDALLRIHSNREEQQERVRLLYIVATIRHPTSLYIILHHPYNALLHSTPSPIHPISPHFTRPLPVVPETRSREAAHSAPVWT